MALVFDFNDLSAKEKLARKLPQFFLKAGAQVAALDVDPKMRRAAGISYREVYLTMSDSQKVTLRVKQTGDVYQVLVNGKAIPIKAQDDQKGAISEVVAYLERGRSAFQKALARARAVLPSSMRTAVPKIEQRLREQIAEVDTAIGMAKERLAELKPG